MDSIVMSYCVTFSTSPLQQGSESNATYLNKCTCVCLGKQLNANVFATFLCFNKNQIKTNVYKLHFAIRVFSVYCVRMLR